MWHTHFLKYFFQNLFYIYKLEHVSSAFVERHLSFIICLGQKSVGSCPRSNFLGVVVQGVIFRKNCPCSKSSGGQLPWENFMGDNYTGANCSGRNIQRYFSGRQNCRRWLWISIGVIVQWVKAWKVIIMGETSQWSIVLGSFVQGECPDTISTF